MAAHGALLVNAYGKPIDGKHEWRLDVIDRFVQMGLLRYCDVCGRPMAPRGRGGERKYCSFACRREANRYRAKMRNRRISAAMREEVDE